MKQASISKALIFASLSALLSSPHATESHLEFKINIKDEIRVFNALVGNYIIDVSLHRDDNPKLGKITVGWIRIEFGEWESAVPACLAKNIESTSKEQAKVLIYNAPLATFPQESMIDVDFFPPPNSASKSYTKFRFQMSPAVLKSAYRISPGERAEKSNEIDFREHCHHTEMYILHPNRINNNR